jgi:hypothetical protein
MTKVPASFLELLLRTRHKRAAKTDGSIIQEAQNQVRKITQRKKNVQTQSVRKTDLQDDIQRLAFPRDVSFKADSHITCRSPVMPFC